MLEPIYNVGIEGDEMGSPIGAVESFLYVDDRDKLPTLTLSDDATNTQYLCWRYTIKGFEFWKICRIRTITRVIDVGVERTMLGAIITGQKTITEQVVEYPFGRASYNYQISDLFIYPYYPQV